MQTILISIVSEQTIPNYLVAKNIENLNNHLFFITSKVLPQYYWLKYAIEKNLKHQVINPIKVESDDYITNFSILESSSLSEILKSYDKIILNVTGGTKIMVLSIIDYFKKNYSDKLHIIYLPFDSKKIIQIFPIINEIYLKSEIKTINEYLNVIGFVNINSESLGFNDSFKYYEKTESKNILDDVTSKKLLDKYLRLKEKSNWKLVLTKMGYSEEDAGYFLESYIYNKIRKDLNLKEEQICLNLKIYYNKNQSNDYEFDIAFVYNNTIYLVETKINLKSILSITNHYSGIKNIFGLSTKGVIVTLRNYSNNEHKIYIDRLKNLGVIGIFDLKDLNSIINNNYSIKNIFNIK
jgi:hypothetical protein